MEKNELGLSFNIEGVGFVETRLKQSLHAVKARAGKAFHRPHVKSACVYDNTGLARLYLKKTENGEIIREEN